MLESTNQQCDEQTTALISGMFSSFGSSGEMIGPIFGAYMTEIYGFVYA